MTAQNCPKCGAKPDTDGHGWIACSGKGCVFTRWMVMSDWNALRYVKPLSSAMQRCMDAVADKPKARRMKANMCLAGCDRSEMPHTVEHDEMPTCGRFACRPVEPTPTEPEWEDIPLSRDEISRRLHCTQTGWTHNCLVSEPGFMGYVYEAHKSKHLSTLPAWETWSNDEMTVQFPIAWRRRIEKKGGA